ncbi:MAG: DMT family transporter, partial [Candidatus Competibacterales bacterium]
MHNPSTAYGLLTITTLCWAGNAVVGRGLRDDITPLELAFWRWLLALAVVMVPAWPFLAKDRSALLAGWRPLVLTAALGVAAFNTLLYTGLQTTTAVNAVLIQATMPALIALLSFVLFREG